MVVHLRVLITVANAEHVRFIRPEEEDNTLHSYSRVVPEDGHRGGAEHAHEPDRDKFPTWVAEQLNHGVASYDELVLAGPPHTLSVIAKHLTKQAEAKVVGKLDKDLGKVPEHDLQPHFKDWVRPVHRAKVLPN